MMYTQLGPAWQRGPGDPVAFTGDADIFCVPCARERWDNLDSLDSEGNYLHPVFAFELEREEICGNCLGRL